jgi:hypothetical protein
MSDRPDHPTTGTSPASPAAARSSSLSNSREPTGATTGDEPSPPEPAATAPPGEELPPAAPAAGRDYRGPAIGLAVALLLVLALVGTAPLWAPLLPWGDGHARTDPLLVERLEAVQRQIRLLEQQVAAAAAAMPRLEQRVGALEQRPATPPPELDEMRRQLDAVSTGMSDLANRLERLANSAQAQGTGIADLTTRLDRLDEAAQAQAGGLSDLGTRLDPLDEAVQAQAGSLSDLGIRLERLDQAQQRQTADLAARLGPLQQELRAQQAATVELGNRVQTVEKTAQSRTGDLTDMGLTLTLLHIRNAVEAGRPFPAEFDALSSLAQTRPEIAAAAAPLAAAAPTGIADRAALAQGLRALAQRIDAAPAAAHTDDGWTGAALDRLRGLVRIRRADEAEPARQAEATVRTAERALAGGDLARAVTAIETLHGAAAEAAGDWLHKARERLAVEAALQRLEALLTARLGDTAAIPGAPG